MKKIIFSAVLIAASFIAQGQVGIGTKTPSTSAVLDVTGTDRGVLFPRVALTSTTDATTITNGNVEGLTVYNTTTVADVVPGYYFWSNNKWQKVLTSSDLPPRRGIEIINSTNGTFDVQANGNYIWNSVDTSKPTFLNNTQILSPYGSTNSYITVIPSANAATSQSFTCSKNIVSIRVYTTLQISGLSGGRWRVLLFLNGVQTSINDYYGSNNTGNNNERGLNVLEYGPIPQGTNFKIEIKPTNISATVQNGSTYIVVEYEI